MSIYACSVCYFGSPQDPMNTSLRVSIIVMLLILVVVLSLFVKFFFSVRKRSKMLIQN